MPELKFLAKYVVVTVGETVIVEPVVKFPELLQPPINQCTVPLAPFAVRVTGVPPHTAPPGEAEIDVGLGGGVIQLIVRLKPVPVTLPSDVKYTVKGPDVEVMVGTVPVLATPLQSKVPPVPTPL
jgi:hypothetical protein